eukprot:1138919-Rhodomonas_salina.1
MHSDAKSTDFTLREGVCREIMGKVLQDKTIPEGAIRDMLQARSFCFPTATVVARNNGDTSKQSKMCALCKININTYGHRFMTCYEMTGAQGAMHEDIAKSIRDWARRQKPTPEVTVRIGRRVGEMWPGSSAEIAGFVPDGV